MSHISQYKIPAIYMRGGTSKGVFFNLSDLPKAAQVAGEVRDEIMLRVIGSPDAYGQHIDGMGGATSSTSKVVIVSKSTQSEHDIDYLFGQVSIDSAFVDWSGNCGNLTAAVGIFAINCGYVEASRIPENGVVVVRIWQANINKTILVHIPISDGVVQEIGDFELDGVTFPSAELKIEFIEPTDAEHAMFPTGNLIDDLDVPNVGKVKATLINAGIPTIFLHAKEIGYLGTELQEAINMDEKALAKFEAIRAYASVRMGLIDNIAEASSRQHTPKIAFVGEAIGYLSASGKQILATDIDLNIRALSMGRLHHAMMGTAAVAIAVAAVIPGTLVHLIAGERERDELVFGHPSGMLKVSAKAVQINNNWCVKKVVMSRSARVLMEGWIRIPDNFST